MPVSESGSVCCSRRWRPSGTGSEAQRTQGSSHRAGGTHLALPPGRSAHGQGHMLNSLVINEELGCFMVFAVLLINVSFSGNLLDNEIFTGECGCIYSSSRHPVHHCTGESLQWAGGTCPRGWP